MIIPVTNKLRPKRVFFLTDTAYYFLTSTFTPAFVKQGQT